MRILLFLLLAVFSGHQNLLAQSTPDTLKSDIILRTYVESEQVPLNREVIYHVELRWTGDLNRYQINKLNEPQLTNLALRGSGSSNRDTGTMAIKQFTFYLRPLEIGMAYIDGARISYTDSRNNTDGSLLSSRIGVKITEPVPEPGKQGYLSVLLYGVAGLLMISIFFFFVYRYQTRKKIEQEQQKEQFIETVEDKYLRLIKETIHLKPENIKDCMADLSHLTIGYLGERFNLPSGNLTTGDTINILRDRAFGTENLERLEDFLQRADLSKFAGEPVSESDFHRYYDTIEIILENQKLQRSKEEDE
jgi:hypothetical protein